MSYRLHATIALDLFVEDAAAMRHDAFERLRSAWSSEEDFPYDSEADVPLDMVVHSLLANALPANLPGCRRSQLEVKVTADSSDDSQTSSRDDPDAAPSEEVDRDDSDLDAQPESNPDETKTSRDSASDHDEPAAKKNSTD